MNLLSNGFSSDTAQQWEHMQALVHSAFFFTSFLSTLAEALGMAVSVRLLGHPPQLLDRFS